MKSYQQEQTVNICGIELAVAFSIIKPYRGARDSFQGRASAGIQLEPDEEGGVDIDAVYHKGEDISELLSKDVLELIEIKIEDESEAEPDWDEIDNDCKYDQY